MRISVFNVIRMIFFLSVAAGMVLLGGELYFLVTNSNATDQFEDEPAQNLSSGLYNAWINDELNDYKQMKAKGGVMVDFDWDGDLDLYYGYQSSHYFENVNGVFQELSEMVLDEFDGLTGVCAGDVDNNGYPDILKMRFLDTLSHKLVMNFGNHVFNSVNYIPSNFLPDIHGQGFLDADLDGDLDIVAIEEEGDIQVYLFLNNGMNPFGEIEFLQAFTYPSTDFSSSRTLAIVDYDNDGDQDVYVVRKFGINWLLENQILTGSPGNVTYNPNPDPFFIEVAEVKGVDDNEVDESGSMGYGAAWGDYDNDEDFDLYLANWGINRLFKNDNGNFLNVAPETGVIGDTLNNGLSWTDLDNDGVVDLWVSSFRDWDKLFTLNSEDEPWDSTFSPQFLSATQDVIAGDYNNDGLIDIFTAGLEMGDTDDDDSTTVKYTSLLFKNVTEDSTFSNHNWVKIKLEGSKYGIENNGWSDVANKSAIGARIKLQSSSGSQIREIISSRGHGSMDALIQHFGLGSDLLIDGITIHWPSRDTETNQPKQDYYEGPFETNRTYTIVEKLGFVGIKGDSNQDDSVDVLDIVLTINEIIIGGYLTPVEFWAVDMNYDEILNILDIVLLVTFLLSP